MAHGDYRSSGPVNNPELVQKTQCVKLIPFIDDFSVPDAHHIAQRDLEGLTGSGMTEKLFALGPPHPGPCEHKIALGNLIDNFKPVVGKDSPDIGLPRHMGRLVLGAGRKGEMKHVVLRHQIGDRLQIALAELLEERPRNGFVIVQ